MLLEVDSPAFEECRNAIAPFAELIKSPEHIHTYQISSISLWNAMGAGSTAEQIMDTLNKWTKFLIPQSVSGYVAAIASRFGKLILVEEDESNLLLKIKDKGIYKEIIATKSLSSMFRYLDDDNCTITIDAIQRGNIKVALMKIGYPVEDLIPFRKKENFPVRLNENLQLRDYQIAAIDSMLGNGEPGTGYGTIVLPCGAGKTIVGIGIMARLCTPTLVICPNIIAARQWIREIQSKTDKIGRAHV